MNFINTHSHVFDKDFDHDREEVLQRAIDAGIARIILPDIDAAHRPMMLKLSKSHKPLCIPLIGIHPTSVKENYKHELTEFDKAVEEETPIGIGEIGIDLHWDTTFLKEQEEVFLHQMRYALAHDLPVVIHVREAFNEIFDILETLKSPQFKGIFHCFSGDYEQAQRVIDMGFYIGIGGVITFPKSGLDKLVENLPLERIVLETDDPWLTPRTCKAQRNEPAFVVAVAQKVAEVKRLPLEEIARITTENALRVFLNNRLID
ncbi:MAG: TatD family hydrolase [Bacteroidales bacterium]|jgi:TatD DNase family protein|nr:TatD family hydrolase [Bacteroidales bacterium]